MLLLQKALVLTANMAVLLLAGAPRAAAAAAACYNVDGTDALDESFQPCNPDADVSPCCASNKTGGDVCMSSGLCLATQKTFQGLLFMNGCTDKTGRSGDCPHICPDAFEAGSSTPRAWNVLQCERGVYCCRPSADATNCCANSSALVTADIGSFYLTATSTTSTTSTSTSISAARSGTTAAAATTTTATNNDKAGADGTAGADDDQRSCPSDKSAIVGGAVGGALGAALLASLGALCLVLARRRDTERVGEKQLEPPSACSAGSLQNNHEAPLQHPTGSYVPPQELSSWGRTHEMQ